MWQESDLFTSLREPDNPGACASCGSYDACAGGCMASKFFVGLDLGAVDRALVEHAGRQPDGLGRILADQGEARRTLREVGYLVAMAEVRTAKPRRKASAKKSASQSS